MNVVASAEALLRPLLVARHAAWWDAAVEAGPETQRRRADTELAWSNALADADLFSEIGAARGMGDALTNRQLDLLHDLLLPNQVPAGLRERIVELEASVESRYARHRGVVAGASVDDNAIKRILRESDVEDERREAWEASKTVGAAVADDVRELARLRNEAARALGHRDWFALSVETSEMDEERLFETLAEADAATAEPFARWKRALDDTLGRRFGVAAAELRPWHYADPFFQEPPVEGAVDVDFVFEDKDVVELARRTFDGIGLETRVILARSDLFPRDSKNQHAFCCDVNREGDVRVLCNVENDAWWAGTVLHELGHGVYALGHSPRLPWLLRDAHLVTTEAIAILMGDLAGKREWLEEVAGLDAERGVAIADRLKLARAASLLVFTRWVLVMTNFERALYADPERDLDSLWWELVAKYQLVTPVEGRRAPDWAAKLHIALAPVYYHTYLYGQIVALQLADALAREAGGTVDRPEAGRFLSERVFAVGQAERWDRIVEQATGSPLSVASLEAAVA